MIKSAMLVLFIGIFLNGSLLTAQEIPVSTIKKQIQSFKKDERGPYYRIKWFCKDGSVRDPKESCPESIGGGIQHASYKPEVDALATNHQLYFGNILSYNKIEEFWDAQNNHSRLKQYEIVKYLITVDNGWIYEKGQFYRGAMQSEDEEEWGIEFYKEILKDQKNLDEQYYLIKQSLKDLPHSGDSNIAQLMRSQSKVIAEEVPTFMDVRIKIHGNPDKTDIAVVNDFLKKNGSSLSSDQKRKLDELLQTMNTYYTPVSTEELLKEVSSIQGNEDLKKSLSALLKGYEREVFAADKCHSLAEILCNIRFELPKVKSAESKLGLLDLSNKTENILFIQSQEWKPSNLNELMKKIQVLSYAALGSGLIELWEWEEVKGILAYRSLPESMSLGELQEFLNSSRGIVEWSTAMVKAVYGEDVARYSLFEPKSYQFIDDRIRSSVVLDLGKSVSQLGSIISKQSSLENDVMGISGESTIRGLNPGYAYGELEVVRGSVEETDFEKDKIYVFERPPSGLKPVAGIMTISEGNLVSHVQLLARNLGIPNAAISGENLKDLLKYKGQKVFYAVTGKGNVLMKLEKDMSKEELGLFSAEQRNTNKIKVPVDRIQLDETNVINMREVNADDSGKICGPKAANLGQLKSLFPDHVVEGLIIPFGIFRNHLDNKMPGQSVSYWEYLNATYNQAEEMKKANKNDNEIEKYQLERMSTLRTAIEKMELNKDFVAQLETEFKKVFGSSLGSVPVFLRSDTNMEDLKEFTGAGLNLTLFNILKKDEIMNGIKRVWASPYTERSLKWRQKYLLNPEYVFPSILVIPGVNVDYSGVVITTGINKGGKDDLTVAFSRGAGGAVDGQSAETRLVTKAENELLSPSREPSYVYLSKKGGSEKRFTSFDKPILNENNIQSIRRIVDEVRTKVPERTDPDYQGAYDMEMGFENDKLWLFQIRPFVENKKAKSSGYLDSISPQMDMNKKVSLSEKI
ncbi:PEP/pyruvate-binding domain-containing protein [Namhaeicola litoreus]|uniref:Phosphoenolpyruvate synthase n=1 Tax=Namhaeicola litoreus TaxID=1052145 RepID=A0ABW3Y249_9FLAO